MLLLVLGRLRLLLGDLDGGQLLLEVDFVLLDELGELLDALVIVLALLVVLALADLVSGAEFEGFIAILLALVELLAQDC